MILLRQHRKWMLQISFHQVTVTKREKKNTNPVPKLIDNKRKQLGRQLNSAQRGQLPINESKYEALLRKDFFSATKHLQSH